MGGEGKDGKGKEGKDRRKGEEGTRREPSHVKMP